MDPFFYTLLISLLNILLPVTAIVVARTRFERSGTRRFSTADMMGLFSILACCLGNSPFLASLRSSSSSIQMVLFLIFLFVFVEVQASYCVWLLVRSSIPTQAISPHWRFAVEIYATPALTISLVSLIWIHQPFLPWVLVSSLVATVLISFSPRAPVVKEPFEMPAHLSIHTSSIY